MPADVPDVLNQTASPESPLAPDRQSVMTYA